MILEYCQILSTTQWLSGGDSPYKKTHVNHPSTVWCRKSISNYRWLCNLTKYLCGEYTKRYNKIHKSESVLKHCMVNEPNIPELPFFEPPLAMPEHCKLNDTIMSYRNYYKLEKYKFAKWKNTKTPYWF